MEMQRLASFALLFVGVYLLVVFGLVLTTVNGDRIPLIGWWPLVLLPAGALVPSSVPGHDDNVSPDVVLPAQLPTATPAVVGSVGRG